MSKIRPYIFGILLALLGLGAWGTSSLPDGQLHLWFLDVGQGDAILARLPAGEWILVDGGPDPAVLMQQLSLHMPFYEKTIDLVVLSHPHADHLQGLREVFQRYQVRHLFDSGQSYDSEAYLHLLSLATSQGSQYHLIGGRNRDWRLGKLGLDIIYPGSSLQGRKLSNANNGSIVMRLIQGNFRAFFSGDLEMEKEAELAADPSLHLRADLLKAGHHGSKTSNTEIFLARIQPRQVIISCGVNNRFHHPFPATLSRLQSTGAAIYRTDLDGTIQVTVGPGQPPRFTTNNKI